MSTNEILRRDERTEVTPFSNPQLVALRFGRLVNELQHHLELAWLSLGNGGHRVREIWHELRLLSRGLTDDETERETWAAKLREAQEYWESQFQREWHTDSHWMMQSDLALVQRGDITPYNARTVSEVLEEALCGISVFLADVSHSLLMDSDHEHKELMSFGHRLDQLIHVRHPHRLMGTRLASGVLCHIGWQAHPVEQETRTAYEIEMNVENPHVTTEAVEELQLRWEQLGLRSSAFPIVQSNLEREEVATRIETVMVREWEEVERESPVAEVGYLGLVITGIEVSREGHGAVEVTSRLGLSVLQRLASSGNRPTSYQDLSDDWEAMGGNEPSPEPVTVRTLLGRLREALRPLGVDVRCVRGLGWRLDDAANSTV